MKTYRVIYRLGPQVEGLKELVVEATSLRTAVVLAHRKLSLRYPHWQLHHVEPAPELEERAAELYRDVEARR